MYYVVHMSTVEAGHASEDVDVFEQSESVGDIRRNFEAADTDNSGIISREEFDENFFVLFPWMDRKLSSEGKDSVYTQLDDDADGFSLSLFILFFIPHFSFRCVSYISWPEYLEFRRGNGILPLFRKQLRESHSFF